MTPHSGILAWEIPSAEEPGALQSMGLQKSSTRLDEQAHTCLSKSFQSFLSRYWLTDELILPSAVSELGEEVRREALSYP